MHDSSSASRFAATRQRGMVLVTVLLLLLMVTVLGTAVLRMQTAEQRIAVNAGNHSIATVNAEATLRYAECGLEGGCAGATWTAAGFLENAAGLFTLSPATGSTVSAQSPNSAVAAVKWSAPAGNTLSYAGPTLQSGATPQYAIEKLPPVVLPGDSMSQEQYNGGGGATPYQITAYANGADTNSHSVLQSTFRP
jgi:type IV pilus assembly protein PilX